MPILSRLNKRATQHEEDLLEDFTEKKRDGKIKQSINPEGDDPKLIADSVNQASCITGFPVTIYRLRSSGKVVASEGLIGLGLEAQELVYTKHSALDPRRKIQKVSLRKINSVLFGPLSVTFVSYLRAREHDGKLDHHLFLSVLRSDFFSIDLKFKTKSDLIAFVIALSELVSRHDKHYFKITNKRLIELFLLRIKLKQLASQQGLTVTQMFGIAIFNCVVGRFAESS